MVWPILKLSYYTINKTQDNQFSHIYEKWITRLNMANLLLIFFIFFFFFIFRRVVSRNFSHERWSQNSRAITSPVELFINCVFPYISSVLLTCVIMELAAASVVHFVNSSYPLPVDEVLFFRQIMHSFFARYGFARNSKSIIWYNLPKI